MTESAPTVDASQVAERVAAIEAQLVELTDRPPQIIAITKRFGIDAVVAARAAGLRAVGESYAQEMATKLAEVHSSSALVDRLDGTEWHFVGALQRNKVKLLADDVALWHSVDRLRIGAEIAKRAPGAHVLVQVNVADTPTQGGVAPADLADLLAELAGLDVSVEGLMAIGRPGAPEDARPGFRLLRKLTDHHGLPVCSMGMSSDWHVAVEEGATLIRLGSVLFGPRPD